MLINRLSHIRQSEEGALTAFGLFMLMGSIVVGGLALDVANAYLVRTQLQATADAAAHAAIYVRDSNDEATAINAALNVAETMMPASKYGTTLTAADIRFGTWDDGTQIFTVDPGNDDAVFVDIERSAANANPVATYFLRFAGIDKWDVRTGSVFETYVPSCFREGFVAQDPVDMQSNNTYENGFCIHSNDHVELNGGNEFGDTTVVSMPDMRDLIEPSSSGNPGLEDALRDSSYIIRILNRLPTIINGLATGDDAYLPDYITSSIPINFNGAQFNTDDIVAGRIHIVDCNGGQKVNFSSSAVIEDAVIVTDCQVHFAADALLRNAILATTSTSNKSISAGAQFTLGDDDNCAEGGDAQVLSLGTVELTAGVQIFGSQIIAMDDILLTSNAVGIEGASLISGGTISVTSNGSMAFCGSGMTRNFLAEYFRMVI